MLSELQYIRQEVKTTGLSGMYLGFGFSQMVPNFLDVGFEGVGHGKGGGAELKNLRSFKQLV